MMNAAHSMCGCTASSPARLPIERIHRFAVRLSTRWPSRRRGSARRGALRGPSRPSERPRYERHGGGLVALAHDLQRAMAALEAQVLDVGGARLADTQPVQTGSRIITAPARTRPAPPLLPGRTPLGPVPQVNGQGLRRPRPRPHPRTRPRLASRHLAGPPGSACQLPTVSSPMSDQQRIAGAGRLSHRPVISLDSPRGE